MFAAVFAAAVLSAACGGSDALLGPDAAQGIAGMVLLGPLCPVATPEDPCPDRPYAATLELFEGGERIATLQSGDDGRFRLGLAPGRYRLHPIPGNPLPTAGDQEISVESGVWTDVTVSYDTGIR